MNPAPHAPLCECPACCPELTEPWVLTSALALEASERTSRAIGSDSITATAQRAMAARLLEREARKEVNK